VTNSFLEQDPAKVHKTILDLFNAHNKDSEGSLKRFFDARDE